MGLFSKKTTEVVEETSKAAPKKGATKVAKTASAKTGKSKTVNTVKARTTAGNSTSVVVPVNLSSLGGIILRPRITEKATMKAETENVYVFEIATDANKVSVRQAVAAMYKVTPTRVSIAYNPSKKVFRRGHRGVVSGVKKAYVYLKKGDKIEIV